MATKLRDVSGERYGRLVAIDEAARLAGERRVWRFKCDCGTTCVKRLDQVLMGVTKSCGCLQKETASITSQTHGLTMSVDGDKTYNLWSNIKRRCYDESTGRFHRYGGRGIFLQDSWVNDPVGFSTYVRSLDGFSMEKSLDRVDNNLGYVEGNLRWATPKTQGRNRGMECRNSSGVTGVYWHAVIAKGEEYLYATATWSDSFGVKSSKKFSVKTYGLMPAFLKACNYRPSIIIAMNQSGAGYTQTHGL